MPKKYKVLLSAYACEPNKGSEPGVGWHWALEISKRGHEVFVLTRANNEKSIDLFKNENNLNFIYYDLPKWVLRLKKIIGVNIYFSLWQIGAFFHIKKFLKSNKIDLIHHITFGVFRQVCYLSFLKIPFVFGPVGGGERAPYKLRKSFQYKDWMKDFFRDILNVLVYYSPLYRLMLKRSKLILVKTKETLDYIPSKYRFKTKIQLEIGVSDVNNLEVDSEKKIDKFKILCVSRFVSLKAIHMTLFAVDILNKKYDNIELTIIGTGPLENKLKSLQKKLKLSNVSWVPWIEQNALKEYYRESNVFLFPSLHDSSGNVVLEALANSLPVICLDLGGPAEIVGQSNLVMNTKDKSEKEVIELIVSKLEYLIQNPNILYQNKIKANERAKHFYWNDVVNRIYSSLET
jgi:glycosyltransferase involved in cell wall biosynthesis